MEWWDDAKDRIKQYIVDFCKENSKNKYKTFYDLQKEIQNVHA